MRFVPDPLIQRKSHSPLAFWGIIEAAVAFVLITSQNLKREAAEGLDALTSPDLSPIIIDCEIYL